MSQDKKNNRNDFKLDEKHYQALLIYLPEGVGITDLDENLVFSGRKKSLFLQGLDELDFVLKTFV